MADERILIVEDDDTIALGLEYALEQEGMHAQVCGTVSVAKDALLAEAFDLAILDINLPDGTGYGATQPSARRSRSISAPCASFWHRDAYTGTA